MLVCLLALSGALAYAQAPSPVDEALSAFERLEGYRTTLRSSAGEVIKYFYKKPGHIRMEFEKPHKGAVLVYDPMKKQVRLRPFGFWKSFEMRLSPKDSLIRSSRGHTVDESDIGALLRNVKRLEENGSFEEEGGEEVGGRKARVIEVRGAGAFTTPDGVNRYRLWLEGETMLPLKVQAFGAKGELLEEVLMYDLEADPSLPMDLFS